MTEIIERPETPEEKAAAAAWLAEATDRAIKEVNEQRLAAYNLESDPIFFQWQRGATYTEQDWKNKVAEIDARFPYPEAPKASK